MRGDLHKLAPRPLELRQCFGPAPLPFEGAPGIERDRRLGSQQLEPSELLRPKPAGPSPLQADEPHEVLADAHGEVDGRLHSGELRTPPGPVGEFLIGRRIRHIDRHLRIR